MPSTNQTNNPGPAGEDLRFDDSNDVLSLARSREYAATHPEVLRPETPAATPDLSEAELNAAWKALPEAQRRGDC